MEIFEEHYFYLGLIPASLVIKTSLNYAHFEKCVISIEQ